MFEKQVNKWIYYYPESKQDVAWDIGAHHGYYTKMLAKKFGKVFAFEPDPANLVQLRKETFSLDNVVIIPLAVSDIDGLCILYEGDNDTGHSMLHAGFGKKGYWVPSTTINNFLYPDRYPRFIKMDIEGMEKFAWEHADLLLKLRPLTIILETHGTKDEMGWKNGNDDSLKGLWEEFIKYGFMITDAKGGVEEFKPNEHYLLRKL